MNPAKISRGEFSSGLQARKSSDFATILDKTENVVILVGRATGPPGVISAPRLQKSLNSPYS